MKTVQAILCRLVSTGGRTEKVDDGQAQPSGRVFGFGVLGVSILALFVGFSFVCGIGLLAPVHAQNIDATLGGNTASECFYIINQAGDTLLTVRGDAKVGIGTTDPAKKLDVAGNARIDGTLEVTGTQTINGLVEAADGFLAGSPTFYGEGLIRTFNNPPNDLVFRAGGGPPAPSPTEGAEIMRLTGTGRLGIGTANPGTPLHVLADNAGANVDLITFDRTTDTPADDDSYDIIFNHENDNNEQEDFAQITLIASAVADGTEGGALAFSVADGVDGSMDEAVRIDKDGNVGIGITAPSEELHVVGSIRMVDGNQANGFVLTSDATGVGSWQAAAGGGVVPIGGIIMWSGTIENIPDNWALCDGDVHDEQQTPDLRDKFVVCASEDSGAPSVAMTDITGSLTQEGGDTQHNHGGQTTGNSEENRDKSGEEHNWNACGTHTHPINYDSHIPTFYALAYIMRTQ